MNSSKLPCELFFGSSFWLYNNLNWDFSERFETEEGHRVPSNQDFFVTLKLVPCILLLKYAVEKYIRKKIAPWAGIKDEPCERPPRVEILEKAHRANPWRKWSEREISALTKQLNWTNEQVREWLKARRKFAVPTAAQKFSESSWRCFCFCCFLIYGLYAHWSKEWFGDIKLCFKDFPQPVTEDLYWYFILALAYYSAWNISQFWDVPRKDPKLLMLHHFGAGALLALMWVAGAHRVGLITLLTHDVGDILIEGSKALKYLDVLKTDTFWFFVFAIVSLSVWITTRNIILPFYIIRGIYLHSPCDFPQSFPFSCLYGPCDISSFQFTVCHPLVTLLAVMSCLHLYWTGIIIRLSYLALFVNKLEDDSRSISDDDDEDAKMKLKFIKKDPSQKFNGAFNRVMETKNILSLWIKSSFLGKIWF